MRRTPYMLRAHPRALHTARRAVLQHIYGCCARVCVYMCCVDRTMPLLVPVLVLYPAAAAVLMRMHWFHDDYWYG